MSTKVFGRALNVVEAVATAERRVSRYLDARRAPRKRVLLAGKLVFGTCANFIDCVIGDISRFGARVRIRPEKIAPNDLYLVFLREWTAYEARVVWRRADGNMSLSFKRSFDLDGAIGPELRVMREFCVAYEDR